MIVLVRACLVNQYLLTEAQVSHFGGDPVCSNTRKEDVGRFVV